MFIPRWAHIVFYPGFFAGSQAYQWGTGVLASKVVGVLAVGLVYALLALLMRFAWGAALKCVGKCPSDGATSGFSKSRILGLLSLFATVGAMAENAFPVPDHVWVLGLESRHPVGLAWDNPVWAGLHSSIQVYLCFGMQHPLEMDLPLLVLGLLILGVFAALMFVLAHRFKQHKTGAR